MVSKMLLGILLSFLDRTTTLDPNEVMNKVADQFGMEVMMCQAKMGFPNSVITKIRHFWHEDYKGTPEETACVIKCVLRGLNLIDNQGNLQKNTAISFIQYNGAAEELSRRLMAAITNECPKPSARVSPPGVPMHCLSALTLANCLRKGVLNMGLKPIGGDDYLANYALPSLLGNSYY